MSWSYCLCMTNEALLLNDPHITPLISHYKFLRNEYSKKNEKLWYLLSYHSSIMITNKWQNWIYTKKNTHTNFICCDCTSWDKAIKLKNK